MKKRPTRKSGERVGSAIADLLTWLWFARRENSGGAELNPPKLSYKGPSGGNGDEPS